MERMKYFLILGFLAFVKLSEASKKKNILFLVADDMRPNLETYAEANKNYFRQTKIYSPNLDALAAKSLLLENAYDQQSLCGPSRTSTLTGRRIDTTRCTDMDMYWREVGGNFTTIPQFFKEHGYHTLGAGKVFHPGEENGDDDQEFSWTDPYKHCKDHYKTNGPKGLSWYAFSEKELEGEYTLEDIECADFIVEKLREVAPKAKSGEQPFFVAMGMKKPHLPFHFPEKYLEYYPEENIELPYDPNSPTGLPDIAWHNYRMKKYDDCTPEAVGVECIGQMNCTYPEWKIKEQRRAYYAAISHVDNEIGRVLDELKNLGLEDDTIISFWGDHGYHLGEDAEWTKWTLFNNGNRVPYMVRVPGVTDNGIRTGHLTELVDLLPTLVEAAGFDPLEKCPEDSHDVMLCTEGSSMMRLMEDPSREDWKDTVFWQFPLKKYNEERFPTHMGYSLRTAEYRYTEYVFIKFPEKHDYEPDWENPCDHEELYDLTKDPQENWNLYDDPQYFEVKQILSEKLHAGWHPVNNL